MIADLIKDKDFSPHTFQEIFQALFQTSLLLDSPIAIWKLPEKNEWQCAISEKVELIERPEVEKLDSGFLVNAFENKGVKNCYFIRADFYTNSKDKDTFKISSKASEDFAKRFLSELKFSKISSKGDVLPSFEEAESPDLEKANFKDTVEEAVYAIEEGKLQKVVLSRQKKVQFSQNLNLIKVFEGLCSIYNNAFTSLIFIPEAGIWIGASPETLISIEGSKFRTSALAGTQSSEGKVNLREVSWTQKEIEEQALVSRYIINCFKRIRLREFEEEGPKTVKAGNLLHLKTDLLVDMKAVDFPTLGSTMLDLLHPTSAVCGMPHKEAFEFIISHETHSRELYAGYLGPVNIDNSICLFVNLRCMKIVDKEAILFAGAGITIDSNPEKEWLETEMKLKTLLNILD